MVAFKEHSADRLNFNAAISDLNERTAVRIQILMFPTPKVLEIGFFVPTVTLHPC